MIAKGLSPLRDKARGLTLKEPYPCEAAPPGTGVLGPVQIHIVPVRGCRNQDQSEMSEAQVTAGTPGVSRPVNAKAEASEEVFRESCQKTSFESNVSKHGFRRIRRTRQRGGRGPR